MQRKYKIHPKHLITLEKESMEEFKKMMKIFKKIKKPGFYWPNLGQSEQQNK